MLPRSCAEARSVVGTPGQYVDGLWTYPVPWAVYLLKTGDKALVGAELLHRWHWSNGAQHSRGRTCHCGRPDRADGDDGGHGRHRHPGLLDDRRLRGPAGLAAYRSIASALGNTAGGRWASGAVRQPSRSNGLRAHRHDRPGSPRLPPCSLVQPEQRQPVRQPRGRQLDLTDRELGLGGVTLGAPVAGPGADHDRCDVRLRLRPAGAEGSRRTRPVASPVRTTRAPTTWHRVRQTGQSPPSASRHHELRIHAGEQPERALVVVGELGPP